LQYQFGQVYMTTAYPRGESLAYHKKQTTNFICWCAA